MIYRNFHPWILRDEYIISNKYKNITVIKNGRKKPNVNKNITILNYLKSNILRDLDNKKNLSVFLKNKKYYPKTYIYDKTNKEIPQDDGLWFIKNVSNQTYGGKGVTPVFKVNEIKSLLKPNNGYIIQKGVSNPLLFNGHKGDMRVHYLVTFYKNEFNFYLFNESHIRICEGKYNPSNLNKNNQISNNFSELNKTKERTFIHFTNQSENYNLFFNKIKTILTDISLKIKNSYPKNFKSEYILEYQLCGPDIIFDENLNSYILEMNPVPAYILKNDSNIIKTMKRKILKTLYNHLFIPVINNKEIDIQNYGFIKL